MSYARFGWEGSDVYVYLTNTDAGLALLCSGCLIHDDRMDRTSNDNDVLFTMTFGSFYSYTARGMLDHLAEHDNRGHTVPLDAIERIVEEYPNIDDIID